MNIRKLGSRSNNPLVNGACFHLFAINSLTSVSLTMKLTRQTVVPLSIKKLTRWNCRNCRDMLDLGLVHSGKYVFLLSLVTITCTRMDLFLLPIPLHMFCYSLHAAKIVPNSTSMGWNVEVPQRPVDDHKSASSIPGFRDCIFWETMRRECFGLGPRW